MNKSVKKTSVFLVILVVTISGLTSISAESIIEDEITIERPIYRFGPNGITPVNIDLQINVGATPDEIEEALVNKCAELSENDVEIKQYLNDSGVDITSISFIRSRGRGLHFDFKVRIPVKRYFKKYPNLPPYNRLIKIPIVYCRYPRDQRAYSTIRPGEGGNETTRIEGGHEVLAVGFLGYTTWLGLFAQRGFILRSGFAGYAMINIQQY